MNVGLLLLTHNDIGSQLLLAAKSVYGSIPTRVEILSVDQYDNPADVTNLAKQYIKVLDEGKGVLVLTDVFGATPSNIASNFSNKSNVSIVSGVNLSMLLNVFNYPSCSLKEMTKKAIEGGVNSIVNIKNVRKNSKN
ncbi:MAG: PTS fructose transporter subunit IIA [Gammaproteobacteria bacterium]|nr:PTS fructose transporter subunit IIA [Gammaproteobacteria bacterium]|tara:strand:+ start:299 stop:709 length:411 start_codon:yes stop_codon:yes gene_type:complete